MHSALEKEKWQNMQKSNSKYEEWKSESKLTGTHAAQGLKHKLRMLSLKHFTQSPVISLTA